MTWPPFFRCKHTIADICLFWYSCCKELKLSDPLEKPLVWVSGAKKELKEFPQDVISEVGYALYQAQIGKTPHNAKPLKGFGGAGILEVYEDFDGDTYRTLYTVRFREAIYVLLSFQKKSTSGIATPHHVIDKIKSRLKIAEQGHEKWLTSNPMKTS